MFTDGGIEIVIDARHLPFPASSINRKQPEKTCIYMYCLLEWHAKFVGAAADEPPKRGSISRNRRDENRLRGCWFRGAACRNKTKRTFKAPAYATQHHAAARRSSPPHDDPSPTGRAPRHGAGIRPPEGRHVSSGHIIRARLLAPTSCIVRRSSSSSVVSGVHTAIPRLTKS